MFRDPSGDGLDFSLVAFAQAAGCSNNAKVSDHPSSSPSGAPSSRSQRSTSGRRLAARSDHEPGEALAAVQPTRRRGHGRAQGLDRRSTAMALHGADRTAVDVRGARTSTPPSNPAPAVIAGAGEPAAADRLRHGPDPHERDEQRQPGETRQSLTERAAASFASVAQTLRERGHDRQAVAHFVNRLVFCMFAADVGLLPGDMFTRMLRHATPRRRANVQRTDLAWSRQEWKLLVRVVVDPRRDRRPATSRPAHVGPIPTWEHGVP